MSTWHPLYQMLQKFVSSQCQSLSRWQQLRLGWYIFGILISQSVVFSRIAYRYHSLVSDSPKVASNERRLRRLANQANFDWQQAYRPALNNVLGRAASARRVIVLVDETAQAEHFRLIMSALWYRGRAIPLAWHLRPANQGQFWESLRVVLAHTALVLPPQVQVIVVADRAFGTPAFTDLVASLGWEWLVRLQGQTRFLNQLGQEELALGWLSRPGQRKKGWGKLFKKQGWRSASLVALWQQPHKEPLLLGSSLNASYELVRLYKYRYAVESLFRDCKSLGFQWEASQVRTLEHAQKVVLGLCWGVLVAVVLGEQVVQESLARLPSGQRHTRPEPARYSLVYAGLERVQSYLVGKVQAPIEWQLAHFEAERWSKQIHQHHAQAFIATTRPSLPLVA